MFISQLQWHISHMLKQKLDANTSGEADESSLTCNIRKDTVKTLSKVGFEIIKGRGRGSHIVITKANPRLIITVPDHRELDRGTLRAIIRQTGLSVKEFEQLVRKS